MKNHTPSEFGSLLICGVCMTLLPDSRPCLGEGRPHPIMRSFKTIDLCKRIAALEAAMRFAIEMIEADEADDAAMVLERALSAA